MLRAQRVGINRRMLKMAWKTLYVTGRSGFDLELIHRLKRSGEDFLTGSFNTDGTYLFWITDNFVLRKLKKIIGGKTIFKYRMRFFLGIDAFVSFRNREKPGHNFTPDQEESFRNLH
jgi:hypothetical protein